MKIGWSVPSVSLVIVEMLLWNAKLTETQIFRELSIEIKSSLIELKSSNSIRELFNSIRELFNSIKELSVALCICIIIERTNWKELSYCIKQLSISTRELSNSFKDK